MNIDIERLLLASHHLENHRIERIYNMEADDKTAKLEIEAIEMNKLEKQTMTCRIEENNNQITLLFIREPQIINETSYISYTQEIFRMVDRDLLLHAYQTDTRQKIDNTMPTNRNRCCKIEGELILAHMNYLDIKDLLGEIFGNLKHMKYQSTKQYLETQNIPYKELNKRQLKIWKAIPTLNLSEEIDIDEILNSHQKNR